MGGVKAGEAIAAVEDQGRIVVGSGGDDGAVEFFGGFELAAAGGDAGVDLDIIDEAPGLAQALAKRARAAVETLGGVPVGVDGGGQGEVGQSVGLGGEIAGGLGDFEGLAAAGLGLGGVEESQINFAFAGERHQLVVGIAQGAGFGDGLGKGSERRIVVAEAFVGPAEIADGLGDVAVVAEMGVSDLGALQPIDGVFVAEGDGGEVSQIADGAGGQTGVAGMFGDRAHDGFGLRRAAGGGEENRLVEGGAIGEIGGAGRAGEGAGGGEESFGAGVVGEFQSGVTAFEVPGGGEIAVLARRDGAGEIESFAGAAADGENVGLEKTELPLEAGGVGGLGAGEAFFGGFERLRSVTAVLGLSLVESSLERRPMGVTSGE